MHLMGGAVQCRSAAPGSADPDTVQDCFAWSQVVLTLAAVTLGFLL